MKKTHLLPLSFLSAIAMLLSISSAFASLLPPSTTLPPDVFVAIPGGTLLAFSNSGSVTATNGKITFDVVTAVYADPLNVFGAGGLDFVYQVQNSAASPDAIGRLTAIDFTGFSTDVGFTPSGSALPGGLFVDGTLGVYPELVDRSLSGGTIGFTFNAPIPLSILPGQTSAALIIETNATSFAPGSFNIIDGGVSTVHAFQPSVPSVPDGDNTAILLGIGLIGLCAGYRALGYCSVA
jgi:hypothetical protein